MSIMSRVCRQLTAAQVLEANELCRQYVGKPLEACTVDEIRQVRRAIADDLLLLRLDLELAIDDLARIVGTEPPDVGPKG
ncbi:hypothetical protein [Flexivirga oryzae]|uniref:Uncharacterized protein n=1 Tax=Flexivirga oryzae TaxID=1794944 RepID=A0A839N860_9MICO|nr:hypothetical protein [Flexivirga oryzae]MBB2892194.1 hypothetical protein [Flexivirga oryzae]